MPLLKFRCEGCGSLFDELISLSRLDHLSDIACPSCGGQTKRAYEGRCSFGMAGSSAGRGGCFGTNCAGCAGCGGAHDE